ncbi:hypothetical protein [Luteitalea sp.]|uniref:hypothetical protein n=1 Tax=Luteitalea sp. TaxID=2004800 RepID=UPI0025C40D8A|nr:hypothetical protein [Luteitalea sp.]
MMLPIPSPEALWRWVPLGFVLTVALELPVLLVGLSPWGRSRWRAAPPHPTVGQRGAAAVWLTAVTYPIVAVALPLVLWPRAPYAIYVGVAEAFAITGECLLYRKVWGGTRSDLVVVAMANVVSATVGMLVTAW